ncbi:MAG: CoA transferase, partial [Caulobacteraceae bacterium]|nr:CoA transferase [Caulobacteraceae bacterium]
MELRLNDFDKAAGPLPLAGMRVLDLTRGITGTIGRFLGELGADVLRIEPPGGGSDRQEGPSAGGASLSFIAANLGKRAATLDLCKPEDRKTLEALAGEADVLIEASRPNSAQATALDVAGLRARWPALVTLSASDFGAGTYADWRATDAVLHALSGELSRSGIPGREPLLPPGELALQCAAAQAAYVVLVAYLARLQTGKGDHLDLSLLDGAVQALDPGFGMGGSATAGVPQSLLPRGRPEARHQYPIIPCKDGYVRLCILAKRQWQGMFEWMGRPAEFADPSFDDLRTRFASQTLIPAITAFLADKSRAEVEAESQRYRVPAAAVLSLEEALETEHMRARGAFTEVEVAPGIAAPLPNGAVVIDGARAGVRGPAPASDQPAAAALAAWREPRPALPAAGFGAPGRPLAGLRVLDLGVIVAGAEQGRLLADFGAEVIKVENAAFPDGARASSAAGMSPGFAAGNRNKRGLGLNLRDPRGRDLFLRLAEQSDVVLSNFKPGVMASLG